MAFLEIKNLHVSVNKSDILKGVNLTANQGEVAAIMGPNGSGKSTLANTLMGHPSYEITHGEILVKGKNINGLEPNERAKLGLFLSFQYPVEVPGVSVANFLRTAYKSLKGDISVLDFRKLLREKMEMLEMDEKFMTRYLNEGFSGGEKKRNEILQLAVLQPKLAILDETDSGLDIDTLRIVAEGVNKLIRKEEGTMGALVITHYQRLLNYIKPDKIHIMLNGKIIKAGGPELALELEEKGYDWLKREVEA